MADDTADVTWTPWAPLSKAGERWLAGTTVLEDDALLQAMVDGQPKEGRFLRRPGPSARWPAEAYLLWVEHEERLHSAGAFHPLAIGTLVRVPATDKPADPERPRADPMPPMEGPIRQR